MKKIRVMPFGMLVDLMGTQSFFVDDVDTTDSLVRQLEIQFPELKGKKYAIAVDKKIVTVNTAIESNNIVALLPPFSGG